MRQYLWLFIASVPTMFFFFFQAEDGIRDRTVTGVQTWALPIRSEEHTSGLQSPYDLVCRLLLEAIYIVVPNQRISFRHSWRGAVVAAVLLQLYLSLFPF